MRWIVAVDNGAYFFIQQLNHVNRLSTFQSSLLRPPFKVLTADLEQLHQRINKGIFPNQYEFETALQTLFYATYDGLKIPQAETTSACKLIPFESSYFTRLSWALPSREGKRTACNL
jgi:hypothetical protein